MSHLDELSDDVWASLNLVARTGADLAAGKYTVYCDLIAHYIRVCFHNQTHSRRTFTVENHDMNGATCAHTLTLRDAFDGKRYKITVEALS